MRLGWEPLDPGSEAYSIFSNRDLSSTSGGQPRAVGRAYKILGIC